MIALGPHSALAVTADYCFPLERKPSQISASMLDLGVYPRNPGPSPREGPYQMKKKIRRDMAL